MLSVNKALPTIQEVKETVREEMYLPGEIYPQGIPFPTVEEHEEIQSGFFPPFIFYSQEWKRPPRAKGFTNGSLTRFQMYPSLRKAGKEKILGSLQIMESPHIPEEQIAPRPFPEVSAFPLRLVEVTGRTVSPSKQAIPYSPYMIRFREKMGKFNGKPAPVELPSFESMPIGLAMALGQEDAPEAANRGLWGELKSLLVTSGEKYTELERLKLEGKIATAQTQLEEAKAKAVAAEVRSRAVADVQPYLPIIAMAGFGLIALLIFSTKGR